MGYLQKKAGGKNSWHLRFVVLDIKGRVLHYYIKETDDTPRKTIDLSSVKLERVSGETKKDHDGFKIIGPNLSPRLIFVTAEKKNCDEWIDALENALGALAILYFFFF